MNEILRLNGGEIGPLLRILSGPGALPDDVYRALEGLRPRIEHYAGGGSVFRNGDVLTHSYAVNKGWVARIHVDGTGKSQIVNVFLPGDIFVVHHGSRYVATVDGVTLTPAEIAVFSPDDLLKGAKKSPTFGSALNWHTARNMNIVSQQAVNLSVRTSARRVLHQLLELWCRLVLVGEADDAGFHLPLSQAAIGELCGLSTVSVNRAFRELRERRLVSAENRQVSFPDLDAACDFAGFDPIYLLPFQPLGPFTYASGSVPDRKEA